MPMLDFKGKQFVYAHHLTVPFRQLNVDAKKSMPEKGGKPSLDDNLIIHGDNLHALKALLPKYAGRIKCIYIDPPYNTGNEGWCYNDKVNSPLIKEWLKDSANPVDKEDLERHDKWLCMMWPRLQLLRELLSDEGVIFSSIGEDEQHRLRFIFDEIFGEDNFVTNFIWKSRASEDNRNKTGVSVDHEFVVCYRKSIDGFLVGTEKDISKFSNDDDDHRGPWRSADLTGLLSKEERPNCHYDLVNPKTKITYECPPKGWRFDKNTMATKISENRILWPSKPEGRPRHKLFLNEMKSLNKNASSFLKDINTSQGTKELEQILGTSAFPFPKPRSLISSLISQVADEDSIILDSFAGSGTTAQAVLALNKEDGGNRKFILVECEKYADEITAERVRRVINGVPGAKDDALKEGLGGSFAFCNLGDEINIENLLKGDKLPSFEELARYAFYTATGQVLDAVKHGADYFVGETESYRVHVIYKPELDFLRSGESALNMPLAESISGTRDKKTALVFATHKFMGQKELSARGITFCQLPYQLYRIMGD